MTNRFATLLTGAALLLVPIAAQAVTFTVGTFAETEQDSNDVTAGPLGTLLYPNGAGAQSTQPGAAGINAALATAFSRPALNEAEISATAKGPSNTPGAFSRAGGLTENTYDFEAVGDGSLTAVVSVTVDHAITTDLAPISDFFRYRAIAKLVNPGKASSVSVYDSLLAPSPTANDPVGGNIFDLVLGIVVEDGDQIRFETAFDAEIGDDSPFGAFFDGSLDLAASWRLTPSDGLTLDPITGSTGGGGTPVAPVPLPASLPLLGAGLADLLFLRRRKSAA